MPDVAAVALPVALFDHNWANSCSLESTWNTDSQDSLSSDETRRGLMDRPYRLQKRRGLTLSRGQVGALLTQARKTTGGRFYSPIGCDVSYVNTFTAASGIIIACDTTNRRFFVGYKAMVITFDKDKRANNVHVGTIEAMSDTQLVFVGGDQVPFNVPIGSHVCPAMETEIDVTLTANVITDTHVTFDLEEKERVGPTALPALAAPESTPAGESTYQGSLVFKVPHNWTSTEIGEFRKSIQTAVGLDTIPQIYGASSQPQGLLSFQALNRAEAFRLLRIFDSRCGSLFSFWLPGETADLDVVSASPTLIVRKTIAAADVLQRRFLSLRINDTITMLRITAVVDNGNETLTITVAEALPALPSAVLDTRLSFACLAKFSDDAFRENWQTDGTMAGQMRTAGLLVNSCNNGETGDNNCDVPPDIEPPDPTDPIDPWEPFECGNPSVAVPMYEDVTAFAKGQWREAVRAADLNMPGQIQVKFKDGLIKDGSHEHAPALSPELMTALLKDHALNYVGVMAGNSNAISRNPYHVRLGGSNPSDPNSWSFGMPALPGVAVTRHLWQRIINYAVGATTYTIDIRFVAEWGSDPSLGWWGTGCYVVAFCNEINPTYSEGSAYAPHNGCTHFRNDPFVWGNYYFPGQPDKKLAHPQALLIAHAAMTWHSPVGYNWFSPDNVRWKPCYAIINGAPWSGNDPEFAFRNTHFGQDIGTINAAAMMLGGAFPMSDFFDWMCLENGEAYGLTALRPTRPGWNETAGDLTPELGNDIAIRVCNPGQSLQILNPCRGHPDEPFGGIGGSHKCWRSSDTTNYLCVSMSGVGETEVLELCQTITTTFGPFNPGLGTCDPITQVCSISQFKNPFNLVLYDYYLAAAPAASNTRFITYKGLYDDPDYVRQDWSYQVPASLDVWATDIGGWTLAGSPTLTNTTIDAGNPVLKSYLRFDPEPPNLWKLQDGIVDFQINDTTAQAGVVARWFVNGFGYQGYMFIYDQVINSITIYKVVNSVPSILAALTLTDDVVDRSFTISLVGSRLGFSTPKASGTGVWSIGSDDCTFQDYNEIGLAVINNVAGTVFRNVHITDNNWKKFETYFTADGFDNLAGGAASQICEINKKKVCNIAETCSSACNCEERAQTNISTYAGSSINTTTTVGLGAGSPDPCGDPLVECGNCPGPRVVFSIKLPPGCFDPDVISTNPYKTGLQVWTWSLIGGGE